jgi:hypothetical protein
MLIKVQGISRHELRSPAYFQRSAGTAPLLRGAYLPTEIGSAFFWLLFLAEQEK